MHRDPHKQFLQTSGWASLIKSGSEALDFIELLQPNTQFLETMTAKELSLFEQALELPPFDPQHQPSQNRRDLRDDRISIIRQALEQIGFAQLSDLASDLDIDETFAGQPIEDLNRLIRSIAILKDTVIDTIDLALTAGPGSPVVNYPQTKEQFISFGGMLMHARTYQGADKIVKLNSLMLYCNWTPHSELGEILVARLFSHSDISNQSGGSYVLNADVTKGGLLKLVLLLKTGDAMQVWKNEPRWRLLGTHELAQAEGNSSTEKAMELDKIKQLPATILDNIIFNSLSENGELEK